MLHTGILALWFSMTIPAAFAQNAGSVDAGRPHVEAPNAQATADAKPADNQDSAREERWQKAAQLKHPSFEQKFSVHQPVMRCMQPDNLRKGMTGFIDWYVFKVVEVVGPTEVLVRLDDDQPISVLECSSEGLVKGQDVVICGIVQVNGSKKHQTTDGASMTVWKMLLLSKEQTAIAEKYIKQAEEKRYRTWRSSKGNHEIEAIFHSYENDKLQLRTRDGKIVKIAPKDLSPADQKYFRDIMKAFRKKK